MAEVLYYAIKHLPTGGFLYQHTSRSSTYNGYRDLSDGKLQPRIFTSKISAQRALTAWLQGVWSHHWEDGMEVRKAKSSRVKSEMAVVPITINFDPDQDNLKERYERDNREPKNWGYLEPVPGGEG